MKLLSERMISGYNEAAFEFRKASFCSAISAADQTLKRQQNELSQGV